jgi:hypothetical protein
MMTHGVAYHDLGADHFLERAGRTRQARRLVAQLAKLGYGVELAELEAA